VQSDKQRAATDEADRDFLVKVYLGSRQGKSGGMSFSLRHFKLRLDDMIDLGLDLETLAHRMGVA
jgi:hypothetical protein